MVSQRDKISPDSIGGAAQKFAPRVARPLLEIGAGNRAKPLGPLNLQLKPEPRAHSPHELFIAIRFIAAQPMVQMRGRELQSHPLAQREQRRGKRDRIPATGKPDDDRRAAPNAGTHQGRLNRAKDSLFNIARHQGRDYYRGRSASIPITAPI